jgi:hypothetical protein
MRAVSPMIPIQISHFNPAEILTNSIKPWISPINGLGGHQKYQN